jgi:hypothetical protein
VTHATRAVLYFLKDKSGRKGSCWWGQQKIADELVMARMTVIRAIRALVLAGEIESVRRGSTSNLYRVLKYQNVTSDVTKCDNASIELNLKKEKIQNPQTDDAALIRKAAGFESLSEGDRRYLAELQRSGTSAEAIRAGVLVGRARRIVADSRGAPVPIRSLRYFAGPIAEAARGDIPAGYIEHVEGWLQRKTA